MQWRSILRKIQTSGPPAASKLTSSTAFVVNAVNQRAALRVHALAKEKPDASLVALTPGFCCLWSSGTARETS
jgi:hypothetical protein